ncbi:hypothetical protein LXA43DRAFT_974139 [Ganoderma leucocontextum]|nr:hypothetical protein LXA43DRAFT_974139 [Ganoderma leucocontextum]
MSSESQAWTFATRGLPSAVLSLATRPIPILPPPLPLPADVAFAGLNPGAIFQMVLVSPMIRSATCIPDMDFSGTVMDVWTPDEGKAQAQTRWFKKGEKVVCMLPASHTLRIGTGALADRVRMPARYVVHKPEGSNFGDTVGVMLPALTARQMVVESGTKEGDRVLANAASGGIGTVMVVQMVRNVDGKGGYVVVDYTQHGDLPQHLTTLFSDKPFDAIIDTLGHQSLYLASPSYLVPSGIYSSLNEWWRVSPWLFGGGRKWMGVSMMNPTLENRERVVGMLGRGTRGIQLIRDSVWEFKDVKGAYEKLGGLHARGKILVRVDPAVGDDEC